MRAPRRATTRAALLITGTVVIAGTVFAPAAGAAPRVRGQVLAAVPGGADDSVEVLAANDRGVAVGRANVTVGGTTSLKPVCRCAASCSRSPCRPATPSRGR